jgi:hypothetical protein
VNGKSRLAIRGACLAQHGMHRALGRVDRAAAAETHEGIGTRIAQGGDQLLDGLGRDVLPTAAEDAAAAWPEGGQRPTEERGGRNRRARDHERATASIAIELVTDAVEDVTSRNHPLESRERELSREELHYEGWFTPRPP